MNDAKKTRARKGRTVRTVTCDLPTLTRPMLPEGVDRMLAGPAVVIDLPRFEGHMLAAPTTLPTPVVVRSATGASAVVEPSDDEPVRAGLWWLTVLLLTMVVGLFVLAVGWPLS